MNVFLDVYAFHSYCGGRNTFFPVEHFKLTAISAINLPVSFGFKQRTRFHSKHVAYQWDLFLIILHPALKNHISRFRRFVRDSFNCALDSFQGARLLVKEVSGLSFTPCISISGLMCLCRA
jgi:hypothetical protein